MAKGGLNKDKLLPMLAIAITVGIYGLERVLEASIDMTKTMSLVMALASTLALVAVYFLISRTKNVFMGLLAALIGYKMMPPSIDSLKSFTIDGTVLYYLVERFAVVLFVLLIIKLYKMQGDIPNKIKLIPVLAAMFVVPFIMDSSGVFGRYLMHQLGGSMLYMYFTQFAFYILAMLIILLVAMRSNYDTLRFICYYEFVALAINILRKGSAVVVNLIHGNHVSGSFYAWIAIFVIGIVMFDMVKSIEKKKLN